MNKAEKCSIFIVAMCITMLLIIVAILLVRTAMLIISGLLLAFGFFNICYTILWTLVFLLLSYIVYFALIEM